MRIAWLAVDSGAFEEVGEPTGFYASKITTGLVGEKVEVTQTLSILTH